MTSSTRRRCPPRRWPTAAPAELPCSTPSPPGGPSPMTPRTAHGTVLSYDVVEYPFTDVVAKVLGTPDLERLHDLNRRSDPSNHDQDSDDHSIFYREYDQVRDLYDRFLVEWILPLYGE